MKEILKYLDDKKISFTLRSFNGFSEIEIIVDRVELGMQVYEDHKLNDFINEVNFAYHHCIYSNRKEYDKIEAMIEDESKVPSYPLSL